MRGPAGEAEAVYALEFAVKPELNVYDWNALELVELPEIGQWGPRRRNETLHLHARTHTCARIHARTHIHTGLGVGSGRTS